MFAIFLSIPLAIFTIALAVVPLVWSIRRHDEWASASAPARLASPVPARDELEELVAA